VPLEAGGAAVRVNALAVSGSRLWIGTPEGAYAVDLAGTRGDAAAAPARWIPLVFGPRAARTNVITALAPLPGGAALAGTDDGGLVLLAADGGVSASPLAGRASEIAPGALAAVGGEVAAGTQGAGLLLARVERGALAVGTPDAWTEREVTALAAAGGVLLAGTAEGAIYEVDCHPAELAAGSAGPK
jgi:hypothetical protein